MSRALSGIGVGSGTACGPVARMAPPPTLPAARAVADAPAEARALREALAAVAAELSEHAAAADGTAADVLSAQAMMAADPALADMAAALISDNALDAPHAVDRALADFRSGLLAAGGYFAERAADLDDVRDRALCRLLGRPRPGLPDPGHPYVLVAEELAPADTARLDPAQVLALVTERGGPTGHTAILAKALGLPAVVGCTAAATLTDGQTVLVDAAEAAVEIDPDPAAVQRARDRERRRRARAQGAGPGRTSDGHPVALLVNLGGLAELESAAAADSEGVGLFRTECLFLDRTEAPALDEQQDSYRRVFTAFAGRRVIVRTLDAGADKPLPFVTSGPEENPALGVRGLRTAARAPELLETQLAAIAAAAAGSGAQVRVMAPMVSLPGEAAWFAERARAHGLPLAGAMVEVPAAALRAERFAAACDFLSIGTNDLAQYTFAADRALGALAELLDPWQPALLQLVAATARAGAALGKPVGVCGEAAADPELAVILAGLGMTSLSAAPACLPEVRAALAALPMAHCRELAALALDAPDAATARARVREHLG
ncbi:phosphotransferase system enzyme I (PtsI) [Streptacidiphilus sp. MAP12-20]|uniref:phosphoenolpyruvate--protein phosphotransferase n=1 Tax=Streptacidiphilus sp. MAP12-20 TaxID=3156299 RepID=UPI0035139480